MSRFSLTTQAIEDLREIGRYTQKRWGQDHRRHYLALLDRCFHTLAENPNQGQRCDEIRSGYRKFPSGQHIVFYCEQNTGGIEIIRVLHERMNLEVHL